MRTLLAIALLASSITLPSGFQSAKWGMSVAEVQSTMKAKLMPGGFYGGTVTIAGHEARAEYFFGPDGLAYVNTYFLDGGPDFEELRALLIEKYGEPTRCDAPVEDPLGRLTQGDRCHWEDAANRVELKKTMFVGILYADRKREPAARAIEEKRIEKKRKDEEAARLKSL